MRTAIVTTLLLVGSTACASSGDGAADSPTPVVVSDTTTTTPATATPSSIPTSDTMAPATPPSTSGEPSASAAPTTTSDVDAEPAVTPSGYERVAASVTTADGEVCDVCLWLADTADARRQGLMGVTDLGDGDGMAFVYPVPHTGTFWMKNTLLPLSIAFFDDQGAFLDAFDMEPCTADPCPVYPTATDFLIAIETTRGDLGGLGVGPGSRLVLTDLPCR